MPIGDRQAFCASQQQALDLSIWWHVFRMLILSLFHLISSHRSFSWKLLIASLCHRSLCHPISSQPSHVFWFFHLISSHLISSHPIWCLLSLSQLFSADHNFSHLFSCHLSFSHPFSSHLSFSQPFRFSQLFSAFRSSCRLILCVLISSLLFSHLLSSSRIYSADLSSCQLVSPHLISSQRTLKSSHFFSGPKPAPKRISAPKQATPTLSTGKIWHREAFTRSKFLHREACTRRNFYTELGKLWITASFYTNQAFVPSKLLPRKSFAHRQKLLHREAFVYTEKLLHTKLWHKEAPTQKSF